MKCSRFLVTAVAVAAAAPGWADEGARVYEAVHHDTSKPLREVIHKYEHRIPTGLSKEIPNRIPARHLLAADQRERLVDPLADREQQIPSQTPPPSLVFDGVNDVDGVVPPDTEGDVGPNHYLQWVNLSFRIYDKSGNPLTPITSGEAFWDGFGGGCASGNDGDPIVVYDHYANRWVVTQFDINVGVACVAVSTTPDPEGSYHRYSFDVGGCNDYPKMGLWSNSYGYAHDDFGSGCFGFTSAVACAFERDVMLNGGAARFVCRSFPCTGSECPFGVLPADLEGPDSPADNAPIPFFSYWDSAVDGNVGPDGVRIWHLNVNWANPNGTTLTVAQHVTGNAFDRAICGFNRSCVPQPSPGERLDTLSSKTMWRAHYRLENGFDSVLLNTTVDSNGADLAGIRWAELHKNGGSWSFFQEGTHAPAGGLHRWMGSIAKDGAGNVCLGYSASSGSSFPSVRYACREPGDPLGTLGEEQIMKAGTGSQTGSANRWGDYSSLTLDSTDDCSFWFTSEYYQTTGSFNFRTSIGNWEYPDCAGGGADVVIDSIVPGIAGQSNTWNISGATPSGVVRVACRLQGGGQVLAIGQDTADGSGNAEVVRQVPPGVGGRTLECAARDDASGDVSPLFVETF